MCLYFPRGLALIVLCVALLLAVSIVAINADWLIFPVLDNLGANVSQGLLDMFWLWSMQLGFKAAYDCIKAFSETDQTEDLKRFDILTLIIHGDDDQIVPIADSALISAKLVKGATLKVYAGAPHGLMSTHKEQFNEDLLAFLRS